MAQLLFGSALWTGLAGLLMAVENLNVVMSRTGLLDVHLEFWVVLGFVFVLLDRRWLERRQAADDERAPRRAMDPEVRTGAPRRGPSSRRCGDRGASPPAPPWAPRPRSSGPAPSRCSPWSLIAFVWETSRRHRGLVGWRGAFGRAVARESFGIVLALLLTPIAIYMLTWVPWFHHFGWSWHAWVDNMGATWRFHHSGIEWTKLDPEDRPADADPPVLRPPVEVDPVAAPDQSST